MGLKKERALGSREKIPDLVLGKGHCQTDDDSFRCSRRIVPVHSLLMSPPTKGKILTSAYDP